MGAKYTFILGAGASVPYGYPTAQQLINRIVARSKNANDTELAQLGMDLMSAYQPSLDKFISERVDTGSTLKAEMLIELLDCESINKPVTAYFLNQSQKIEDHTWYHIFFNEFIDKKSDLETDPINIINFNYDRSLITFLRNLIKSRYKINKNEEIFRLIRSKFKIIHPHGRLPTLPGEKDVEFKIGYEDLEYGTERSPALIRSMYDYVNTAKIMTCYENAEVSSDIANMILDSNRVIFLGFSYHEENMKFLFPSISKLDRKTSKVEGTLYNVAPKSRQIIAEKYGKYIDFYDLGCREFFNNRFFKSLS